MIAAFVEILFRTLKSMEYLVELYSIQSRLNQARDRMTLIIDGKSKQKVDSRQSLSKTDSTRAFFIKFSCLEIL